jgi:hypothetical protein
VALALPCITNVSQGRLRAFGDNVPAAHVGLFNKHLEIPVMKLNIAILALVATTLCAAPLIASAADAAGTAPAASTPAAGTSTTPKAKHSHHSKKPKSGGTSKDATTAGGGK